MQNVLIMHGNLRVDINDIINEQNNKLRFNELDYTVTNRVTTQAKARKLIRS